MVYLLTIIGILLIHTRNTFSSTVTNGFIFTFYIANDTVRNYQFFYLYYSNNYRCISQMYIYSNCLMTLQDTRPLKILFFQFQVRFENILNIINIFQKECNIVIVLCVYKKFICDSACGKSSRQNTSRRNSCFQNILDVCVSSRYAFTFRVFFILEVFIN